jgi:hypothetical protein
LRIRLPAISLVVRQGSRPVREYPSTPSISGAAPRISATVDNKKFINFLLVTVLIWTAFAWVKITFFPEPQQPPEQVAEKDPAAAPEKPGPDDPAPKPESRSALWIRRVPTACW